MLTERDEALAVLERAMNERRKLADNDYDAAMKQWRHQLRMLEQQTAKQLKDDTYARSLGLPAPLPTFTIRVLKRTIAGDKLGPSMPKRSTYYLKYGIPLPKPAS